MFTLGYNTMEGITQVYCNGVTNKPYCSKEREKVQLCLHAR